MDAETLHYSTGEEVHAGDRVWYNGAYATVVFVSDGELEEFSPGYEENTGSGRGLIVCDDDGEITSVSDPDERLSLVERG